MTLVGAALLLLFAANIVRGWAGEGTPELAPKNELGTPVANMTPLPGDVPAITPPPGGPESDPAYHLEIAVPYDNYFLTQGVHGQSYGHLAIDIAAGNGATIKSIINGIVTSTGYDQWGNTYIQIENDNFIVLYPVSYTHLDVYKRQMLGWSEASPRLTSRMARSSSSGEESFSK